MRYILFFSVLALLVVGCQRKEVNSITKESSSDLFNLRITIDRLDSTKLQIHKELVYTGDQSIEIIHADPLVGWAVGKSENRPDIVFSFVGISKTIEPNEVYVFDDDDIIDIPTKGSILFTQAFLTIKDEQRSIELEINLDDFN